MILFQSKVFLLSFADKQYLSWIDELGETRLFGTNRLESRVRVANQRSAHAHAHSYEISGRTVLARPQAAAEHRLREEVRVPPLHPRCASRGTRQGITHRHAQGC